MQEYPRRLTQLDIFVQFQNPEGFLQPFIPQLLQVPSHPDCFFQGIFPPQGRSARLLSGPTALRIFSWISISRLHKDGGMGFITVDSLDFVNRGPPAHTPAGPHGNSPLAYTGRRPATRSQCIDRAGSPHCLGATPTSHIHRARQMPGKKRSGAGQMFHSSCHIFPCHVGRHPEPPEQ